MTRLASWLLTLSAVALFGVSPAGAVPVQDGSLQLWLDATDSSTLFQDNSITPTTPAAAGDPVGTWLDKSGNGHHAQANTDASPTGQRPVATSGALGGQAALRFDAIDDGMDVSNALNLSNPYTVIVVDQYNGLISDTAFGATRRGRSVDSRSTNWLIGKWNGGNRHFAGGFVDGNVDGMQGAVANVPVIGAATNNGTASAYFRNGTDVTSNSSPVANPGRFRIGRGTGSETSDFDISELVIYNRVLNGAELIATDNHLSSKYGISVTTDLYDGDTIPNGSFNLGVIGVGQVAAGNDLTNSSSDGLSITATGGLGDGEWAFAGHKSTSNSVVPIDDINSRWERTWYFDFTNDINEMDLELTFDASDAGFAPGMAAGFNALLFAPSDGAPFSVFDQTTISGDQFTFTIPAGTLTDGVLTLGTAVPEPSTGLLMAVGLVGLVRRRRQS